MICCIWKIIITQKAERKKGNEQRRECLSQMRHLWECSRKFCVCVCVHMIGLQQFKALNNNYKVFRVDWRYECIQNYIWKRVILINEIERSWTREKTNTHEKKTHTIFETNMQSIYLCRLLPHCLYVSCGECDPFGFIGWRCYSQPRATSIAHTLLNSFSWCGKPIQNWILWNIMAGCKCNLLAFFRPKIGQDANEAV